MVVYIGCDHAAFDAKEALKAELQQTLEVVDCGTFDHVRCDYPRYARAVAQRVHGGEGQGILLCGSGAGVCMAANRYAGVRATVCRTAEEAQLAVAHNNCNLLCLGARFSSSEQILTIARAWLTAQFEGGRHAQRLAQFEDLGEKL